MQMRVQMQMRGMRVTGTLYVQPILPRDLPARINEGRRRQCLNLTNVLVGLLRDIVHPDPLYHHHHHHHHRRRQIPKGGVSI